MKIVVVSKLYPSQYKPWEGVFVHELMKEFVLFGVEPFVISPKSMTSQIGHVSDNTDKTVYNYEGISVLRPKYISFSNKRLPFGVSTYKWSVKSFCNAINKQVIHVSDDIKFCYGHFLYPSGKAVLSLSRRLKVPAIVALGESSFEFYRHYSKEKVSRDLNAFDYIVAVSNAIKKACVCEYHVPEDKIRVFPNGIDTGRFYKRSKNDMRKRYKLPMNAFIIIFVGHLDDRKGPLRLMESIGLIPEIKVIFLGSGPQTVRGEQILFQGNVSHEDVPEWLSASDVFVLPTLQEGCSNAVVEAMACGLPVISSDLPFNYDIVNDNVGILVDPCDSASLRKAIYSLHMDSELRLKLGQNARQWAQNFSLRQRAMNILEWIRP